MQDAIARWDKFLAQIEQRLQSVLTEAQQGCAMLLDQTDLDTQAMSNAWTGMHARAQALSSKVDDTWNDKVDPALDDADAPAEVSDAQRAKGEALTERIDVEIERVRIAVFCDAARKVWQRAAAEAPSQLQCTQCNGAIEAPKVLVAVNVPCPYCQAVNTFEPGMRARMIEHYCAHYLCEEAAWNEWLAMRRAEQALHAARPVKLVHFQGYEAAQITYWRKYLETQATMLPHKAAAMDADLRGKLQQWYGSIEHEKAWADAGRPRALQ